jgi:chloramphenicol 3-O phosphotransferase
MRKRVILLNGPSSSGKSTLSRALQGMLAEKYDARYAIISIDDFMKLATDETIYEDDVYEISGDMCMAALAALETSAGVIIDHVITSERIFSQLMDVLGQAGVHLVHVACPLNVLLQREHARGNRCQGTAEASFTYLFPKDGYELTVDTSVMPTGACAAAICTALLP